MKKRKRQPEPGDAVYGKWLERQILKFAKNAQAYKNKAESLKKEMELTIEGLGKTYAEVDALVKEEIGKIEKYAEAMSEGVDMEDFRVALTKLQNEMNNLRASMN